MINYNPNEFELLKKLALDGRKRFSMELSSGEKEIQHLCGYRLIEKDDSEYFIRIKSIEEYIRDKFIYDQTLSSQSDIHARLNARREKVETKLRKIISYNLQMKYGKKAKEKLMEYASNTTSDKSQNSRMIDKPLSKAMEELYCSQLKDIMLSEWKYYQNIFDDRVKFEYYFDLMNESRGAGDHAKTISDEEEAWYSRAFKYFEEKLAGFE